MNLVGLATARLYRIKINMDSCLHWNDELFFDLDAKQQTRFGQAIFQTCTSPAIF